MSIYAKTQETGSQKIDSGSVAWHRDIGQFAMLEQDRDALLAELHDINAQADVRSAGVVPANRTHRAGTSDDVVSMGTRLRLELREGALLRRSQARRLRDVEARLVHTENEMHQLQMRILTFEPKTAEDAATMVALLPRFDRAGHSVPADYAEEIIETCARAAAAVSGTKAAIRVL